MYNIEEARTIIAGRTNLRVALNDKEILLHCKDTEKIMENGKGKMHDGLANYYIVELLHWCEN